MDDYFFYECLRRISLDELTVACRLRANSTAPNTAVSFLGHCRLEYSLTLRIAGRGGLLTWAPSPRTRIWRSYIRQISVHGRYQVMDTMDDRSRGTRCGG